MVRPNFRIAFVFDFGSYVAMRALLESHRIEVLDIAVGGHVSVAGADQGYYVEVLPEDHDRACRILRENGMGKYIIAEKSDS